jgi:hypothetical protein
MNRRFVDLPLLDLRQVAASQMCSEAERHNPSKRSLKRQANHTTDWARNRCSPLLIVGVDNLAAASIAL